MDVVGTDLIRLFELFPDMGISIHEPMHIGGKKFDEGEMLTVNETSVLKREERIPIRVRYSFETHRALHAIDPVRFRLPYAREPIGNVEKIIRALEQASTRSGRERYLIAAEDIYDEKGVIVLSFGEKLSMERFTEIKARLKKEHRYAYRPNEVGMLVLIDLRPRGDDYLKRFHKNSELVTILLEHETKSRFRISPDMSRVHDVHAVDNFADLLCVYQKTDARLVVVGDAMTNDYKNALRDVKRYDRYARFMLAINVDTSNPTAFFKEIALNYHRNPWLHS